MATAYDPSQTDDNLVCLACGTQFPSSDSALYPTCLICDDPRQYVPPTGQAFTTMGHIRRSHRNEFHPYSPSSSAPGPDSAPELTFITTTPKLSIGQRAILVRTPRGNILWDCLTLIDPATVAAVRSLGGLAAIVVSHPHYYSSHAEWSRAFGDCPVYLSAEDFRWAVGPTTKPGSTVFVGAGGETEREILPGSGCKAIKLGGHFPGSLVLLTPSRRLLVADTLLTTPAGLGDWSRDGLGRERSGGGGGAGGGRPEGMNSFAFMWSIPNSIPLSGEEVFRMWSVLKEYDFRATHGAFPGQDIEDEGVKGRVLESMRIQTRFMGWARQELWDEA